MTPEERTEMYGHWSTAELALKARWKELQEAKLQNQELKAALLDLVYWSPNEEHFYPAIREGHIVDDIVGKLLGVSREPSKCGAILRGTPAFPDVACGAPMPCSVHTERVDEIAHCYTGNGHCTYLTDRRCICLCAKCEAAKKADH